ncbi:MAG: transcription termination factor Rho [Thermodesulfobacteriota bacterium]
MGGKKKKEQKEKPLDKMTAKELREYGLALGNIFGVHSMNKIELLSAIRQAKGIVEEGGKKGDSSVREIKKKIKDVKAKRDAAAAEKDQKTYQIMRRRVSRLKKKTRRAA